MRRREKVNLMLVVILGKGIRNRFSVPICGPRDIISVKGGIDEEFNDSVDRTIGRVVAGQR